MAIDTTFGLAYYRLALTRGWIVGATDSIADTAIVRATTYASRLPAHDRTVINAYRAFLAMDCPPRGRSTSSSLPAIRATPTPGTAWARRGSTIPTGTTVATSWTQAMRAFSRTLALDPELRPGLRPRRQAMLLGGGPALGHDRAPAE